jgi:hypothetical protein
LRTGRSDIFSARAQVALAVLRTLLLRVFAVESRTSPGAALATMGLSAPEPATQIVSTPVAWVGEKEDPTVLAALQAAPQVGPLAQQRPNLGIIRPNQIAHRFVAMPIGLKLKMRLDFLCYKPRRCATMLMFLGTSPSYVMDTFVSSRTGTFSSAVAA